MGQSKVNAREPAEAARDLKSLPLTEVEKELGSSPKGLTQAEAQKRLTAAEKTVLAWWLRERTVVPLRWVGQLLEMGHYTRVTQAVSRMKQHPARKLQALKKRLLAAEKMRV